jgi:hypothetical protein
MKRLLFILFFLPLIGYSQLNVYNGNFSISDSNYEDMLAPASTLKQVGVNAKPVYNNDSMGYQMIATDTTEQLGMVYQLPHAVKVGTKLNPHIHWIQSYAAENPRFVMSYSVSSIGGTYTTAVTYMLCNTKEIAYTSGRMHQISECMPWILGTNVNISSIVDVKVRCTAGGNQPTYVILKAIDIHYRMSSLGSSKHDSK